MPEETIADIAAKCRVLLLDIEGTTTSISFVKDKLFPYAATHVRGFLEEGWEDEDVQGAVAALRKLAISDEEQKVEGVVQLPAEDAPKEEQIDGVVRSVEWLMSKDRKEGALKQLQGLIWQKGYSDGALQGHVYEDVAGALAAWRLLDDHLIYIYSSGSEQAQKLLFAHSEAGDLLKHIDGHFDTNVGHKQQEESYKNIAEKIGCEPEKILFLTDVLQEAEAAVRAGLRAALVRREGNAPLPQDLALPTLTSLAELLHNSDSESAAPAKRKLDSQEEQPAKIPKGTLEDDVKSSAENLAASDVSTSTMDVDAATEELLTKDKVVKDVVAETIEVKEIDELSNEDVAEPVEAEVIEIEEPAKKTKVTEDSTEITIEKETEKSEAETAITEIEEITDVKIDEVVDSVDIEPIVEEPADMAVDSELENIKDIVEKECGELEKECDEILSKVKDVTELAQPLLETIGEESENAENVDTLPAEAIEELATKESNGTETAEVHLNGNSKESNGVTHNGSSNGTAGKVNGEGKEEVKVAGAEEGEIKVKSVPTAETSEPASQAADA